MYCNQKIKISGVQPRTQALIPVIPGTQKAATGKQRIEDQAMQYSEVLAKGKRSQPKYANNDWTDLASKQKQKKNQWENSALKS